MKKIRLRWGNSSLFFITLLGVTFYNSYRYPLQINFSGTSPTYSDTPFAFQVGKYIFLVLMLLLAVPKIRLPRHDGRVNAYVACIYIIFFFCLFRGGLFGVEGFLIAGLMPLCAFFITSSAKTIELEKISSFSLFLVLAAVLTNLIQVGLFFTTGRLPALAYEDSFSVRFGSFLDDPNGFCVLAFYMLGWSLFRKKGNVWTNRLLVASVIVSIVISQSATALGFLAALCFLGIFSKQARLRRLSLIMIFGGLVITYLYGDKIYHSLFEIIESKQESAAAHVSLLSIFDDFDAIHLLFGSNEEIFSESWWVYCLRNHGIVIMLLFGYICFVPLIMAYKQFNSSNNTEHKQFLAGYLFLGSYFVVGGLNLPFALVFPCNAVFFLLSAIVMLGRTSTKKTGCSSNRSFGDNAMSAAR